MNDPMQDATAADVLEGSARWSVECGDAIALADLDTSRQTREALIETIGGAN